MIRHLTAWFVALALAGLTATAEPAGEPDHRALVLVTSHDSPIDDLSAADLRLSYLAVPVRADNVEIRPVLNRSDDLLHEVFLQKVIYLSSQHYSRQIVSRVFQSGGTRPATADSESDLVALLRRDPRRISYMWRRDAQRHEGIKAVDVLWEGSLR